MLELRRGDEDALEENELEDRLWVFSVMSVNNISKQCCNEDSQRLWGLATYSKP